MEQVEIHHTIFDTLHLLFGVFLKLVLLLIYGVLAFRLLHDDSLQLYQLDCLAVFHKTNVLG